MAAKLHGFMREYFLKILTSRGADLGLSKGEEGDTMSAKGTSFLGGSGHFQHFETNILLVNFVFVEKTSK